MIINLYLISSEQERRYFDEMLKIGNPKYRRYCSPLQALFWLGESVDITGEENPIRNYSLEKLLGQAWIFGPEFTRQEAILILQTMKNKEFAKKLLEGSYNTRELNKILNIIKYDLNLFEDKKIFKGKGINRWKDFREVTERLNSPELIDYYERANFSYVNLQGKNNEYDVFSRKYGDCVGVSLFTEYCLRKAGYKAYIVRVVSPTGVSTGHRVCYFEVENKGYIMDNGSPYPKGIVEKEAYLKSWGPIIGYGP
ncbi:MAG: transglutaminase-like domain-containing protein [Candidatus Jordarchaeum sp.]|uniref:transglutaminase-like domain-containing protein n=1 Tax=Candidatus Jordarchaeum sp. TaxID=2823881 RepID=UPI00404AA414